MKAFVLFMVLSGIHFDSVNAQSGLDRFVSVPMEIPGKPIVVIDSFRTFANYLVINPRNIDSINIFKDSMAIVKFGDDNKFMKWSLLHFEFYQQKKVLK